MKKAGLAIWQMITGSQNRQDTHDFVVRLRDLETTPTHTYTYTTADCVRGWIFWTWHHIVRQNEINTRNNIFYRFFRLHIHWLKTGAFIVISRRYMAEYCQNGVKPYMSEYKSTFYGVVLIESLPSYKFIIWIINYNLTCAWGFFLVTSLMGLRSQNFNY